MIDLDYKHFRNIANESDRAILRFYGKTHEGRKLAMLVISSPIDRFVF